MAAIGRVIMIVLILALVSNSLAADPDPLQDVCVADLNSVVKVNGYVCKTNASSEDFFSDALVKPGSTNNLMGSHVFHGDVMVVPGINTLGVSVNRLDVAPGGINPPHSHPRASELFYVLEGELYLGFITTNNVLYSKYVKKGEFFVFPRGLIHFQINNGKVPAAALAFFNSQLPGVNFLNRVLFESTPPVPENVLAKAFQLSTKEIEKIRSRLGSKK